MDQWTKTLHLFSLSFKEGETESSFQRYYFETNLYHGRLCHVLAILFYSADGIRDFILFPQDLPWLVFIRYGVVVPLFTAGLILSYLTHGFYQKIWQPLFAFYFLVTGVGAIVISTLASPPLGQSLYVGLIYCLVFGYTFIRLRFLFATLVGLFLTAVYIFTVLWVVPSETTLLWIQLPFVVGINLLGMFVAYAMEYNFRKGFFFQELLTEKKDQLDNANKNLESRIKERTRELGSSNRMLLDRIDALRKSEMERHKLEAHLRQAYKMEAIGTLAGGIAHDFNNVLGIILGNAELALDDVPDWNPANKYLKEIRTACFRAKEVVRQILSFASKTMTALKPLEINTVVKESLKLIRASIPAMVDIQQNIPAEPKIVLGDPTEIHQIIINLCTNAAHAMKKAGGVLEVGISDVALSESGASRYEDLSPGDYVKLTVRDSGEGISPEAMERVFEPYFTTKQFGAGSGMGLAVVYGLVKKCKGAIHLKSAVGQGTTVEVLFPKIEKVPAKETEEYELPVGDERILLVDDDPSIVDITRQMLERLGYTVSSTTESKEALERFRSAPNDFDLVITDMSMPKVSGDQLAAELMKIRNDMPILLCTGHSDTIDEKKAKELGIRGFAMKPLDKSKLAMAVRAALGRK